MAWPVATQDSHKVTDLLGLLEGGVQPAAGGLGVLLRHHVAQGDGCVHHNAQQEDAEGGAGAGEGRPEEYLHVGRHGGKGKVAEPGEGINLC
ncbi:MAG: hypothetical protein NZ777_11870 [Pseudomonadales bacterium]|nr:hypothetical protein [Pseudomonadales bacterium]